jgi:hypothetical protein
MASTNMTILDFIHSLLGIVTVINYVCHHEPLAVLLQFAATFLCLKVAISLFYEHIKTCIPEPDAPKAPLPPPHHQRHHSLPNTKAITKLF